MFQIRFLYVITACIMRAVLASAMTYSTEPFNETLAAEDIWLNQVSACTSADPSSVLKWNCGLPCQKTQVSNTSIAENQSLKILAFTGLTTQGCLIVFRGSANMLNYLEDFDFFMTNPYGEACPNCKVHSGFLRNWQSLEPKIRTQISALNCQEKALSIVGHSLGAAMAALAAFELAAEYTVRRVYTYGQPRLGNGDWVSAFSSRMSENNASYFRVVDYRDAVPHLPPDNFFSEGWEHPGPEVYYNATAIGDYRICRKPRDKLCSYQWNLLDTLAHTCDHCSYLGLNPCTCGASKAQCIEGLMREVQ